MYCQSCQTKLSPRDESCPTCGRSAGGRRDLGNSGSGTQGSKRSYPLPPASSKEPDANETSKPRAQKKAAAPRAAKRGEARKRAAAPPEPPRRDEGGMASVRPDDVRRMLIAQPDMIEPGLEIYREDGAAAGAGYSTAVGDIDLLAVDDAGAWVVISVPEAQAGKDIVGELLQRMGWVRRHLGESGQEVRGIVLMDALPDDLGYAAAAVSDTVEFKIYQLALTLESVIV